MGRRCLIVDDSPPFLDSASRLLSARGWKVVGCASGGEEALRIARALGPDIALVDLDLGGEDGEQVATRLVVEAPTTKVVLISAYEQEYPDDALRASGAVAFLPKTALGTGALETLFS